MVVTAPVTTPGTQRGSRWCPLTLEARLLDRKDGRVTQEPRLVHIVDDVPELAERGIER